jgi:signal transduction histidine kinase
VFPLELNSGFNGLYVGPGRAAGRRAAGDAEPAVAWTVVPTLSEGLERLRSDPRLAFEIDAVVFEVEALSAEPHLAVRVLAFAPRAVRGMVYDVDGDPRVAEMGELFDVVARRSAGAPLGRDAMRWLRGGAAGPRRLLEAMPSGYVLVHRESGAVLVANRAARALLGAPGFDGGRVGDLATVDLDELRAGPWRGAAEVCARPGHLVSLSSRPIMGVWLALGLAEDEADLARTQGGTELGDGLALGRAAVLLAHELANPLGGLRGMLQLAAAALTDGEPDRAAAHVARSLTELGRLGAVVRSYLAMTRPGEATVEPVSLRSLLDEAVADLGDYLRDVGVRAAVEHGPEDLRVVFGVDEFRQIAWNAAKNAVDAMLRAGCTDPRLTLRVEPSEDDAFVCVCFDDVGPGIEEDAIVRAFEPFFTGKGSTGVGLTVSRMLARRFGATLTLENLRGGGGRAKLRLKLERTRDEVRDEGAPGEPDAQP